MSYRVTKSKCGGLTHAVKHGEERTLCGVQCGDWKVVPGESMPTHSTCKYRLQAAQGRQAEASAVSEVSEDSGSAE